LFIAKAEVVADVVVELVLDDEVLFVEVVFIDVVALEVVDVVVEVEFADTFINIVVLFDIMFWNERCGFMPLATVLDVPMPTTATMRSRSATVSKIPTALECIG